MAAEMRALSIDDAYVVKMSAMLDATLAQAFLMPSCTDKNREEIQQCIALMLLIERRMRRMGLTHAGRMAVGSTALELLAEIDDGEMPTGVTVVADSRAGDDLETVPGVVPNDKPPQRG